MAKSSSDPLALVRKIRLQEFCKRKGWWDSQRQIWHVTEIAAFFGKHKQKMSDLLGGRGSFGAKIARELEQASGSELPAGHLDDLAKFIEPNADRIQETLGLVAAEVGELNRPDYAESISDTLGESLMTLHGEMSRRAVEALGVLARAPDSPRARGELMDVLQHAKLEALAGDKQRISLELVAAQLRGAYAAALKLEPKPSPEEFVKGFMDTLLRHNR